jgi:hypothetical protein
MRKPELGKSGLAVRYWLFAVAIRKSQARIAAAKGERRPANSKRRIANDAFPYDAQRGGQSGLN